jgi:hypothetical protein
MKVLIACEESQVVCNEFRKLGHEAYSNDIQECSGGHPEWHLKMDCFEAIKLMNWDLMIGHPPCTYLSYAGIGWFNIEKYGEKAIQRYKDRDLAVEFFLKLWNSPIDKICLENPRGYITSILKPSQLIQPYYFGDSFSKPTYLWLKNLPLLYHNKEINLFDQTVTHVDKGKFVEHITKKGKVKKDAEWYYYAVRLPKEERQKMRSKTFPRIALAMATQWG